MLSSPFSLRLLIAFACAIGLTTIVIGLLESRRVRDAVDKETELSVESGSVLLMDVARPVLVDAVRQADGSEEAGRLNLDAEKLIELQRDLERLVRESDEPFVRFSVFDRDGVPVADSRLGPSRLHSLEALDEAQRERLSPLGRTFVLSARSDPALLDAGVVDGLRRVDASAEVSGTGTLAAGARRTVGFVRASLPNNRHKSSVGTMRRNLFFGVGLGALVAAIAASWIARHLAMPLQQVGDVLHTMAEGDFSRRVDADRDGLLGDIARSCNRIGATSKSKFDSLSSDRHHVVATLGSMVEGVVATDEAQRVLFINDVARRMLSVELETSACVGQAIWEISRVPRIGAVIDAVLEGDQEVDEEIALTGLGGDLRLDLHASPLRGESASLRGAVIVLHDVTELRRLEQVRRDFVANVSHELKTPITVISGVVEMLLDDPEMDVGMREHFLRKLADQSDRLTALVKDQLTLARVEARGIPRERVRMDFTDIVGAGVSLVEALAERKGIAVTVDVPDQPALVDGDTETLRQVVNNLLGNAVSYTPEGGSVRVAIWLESAAVVFDVEDTGVGLSVEDQQRVFERFYRVDRSRGRELGGTGLGLSIVRNVVIAHGGEVSVESELGRGSTFSVRLPRADSGGDDGGGSG